MRPKGNGIGGGKGGSLVVVFRKTAAPWSVQFVTDGQLGLRNSSDSARASAAFAARRYLRPPCRLATLTTARRVVYRGARSRAACRLPHNSASVAALAAGTMWMGSDAKNRASSCRGPLWLWAAATPHNAATPQVILGRGGTPRAAESDRSAASSRRCPFFSRRYRWPLDCFWCNDFLALFRNRSGGSHLGRSGSHLGPVPGTTERKSFSGHYTVLSMAIYRDETVFRRL